MSKTVKQLGVYVIYNEGVPTALFYRDETAGENLVFTVKKASLDDMEALFTCDKEKI
jgi:hypothetical protein